MTNLFHENGEKTVGLCSGNLNLDDTVLLATDPGNTGMDQNLELAGVQVMQGPSGSMVVATVFTVTLRAPETACVTMLQGNMKGLTFHLKPDIHHFPWRGQTQYLLI